MNYTEMGDFEINKAVAIALGYPEEDCEYGWTGKPDVGVEWGEETGYPTKSFDFCNSWADAGPIIEKYRVTIMPASQGENWMAQAFEYALTDVSTRPLRSAMIVFLMMQESK